MPVALYMFGLSYTNPKRSISPFVFPILAGVSALLLFADSHSTLLNVYNPALMTASHWGFSAPTGPAYIIISLWIVLLTLATVLLLIRFRRRTLDPQLRNQTKLFVIALVIPLSIGTVTDGILPVLDINILPPMAVFLLTITALMISYSILKQKFLSFTPDIIAKEVLGTMNEAVIGVTADFRLSYVNSGAERLFGRAAHDLTNISIQDVLADAWTSDQLRQKIFFPLSSQEFYTIDSVRFIDSSGKPIVTKLSVSRIGNDNQASGYLLVITDISDLAKSKALIEQEVVNRTHQLRDEKAKLLSSIESLNIGFLLINIGGVVNLKNKAINNIFGLSGTEEITTKYLEERLVGVDFNEISQQLWRGQSITIDQVALGTKILKIFFGPVLTDEKNSQKQTIGWVVLIEDITEATIQERSKDEFFSIASHELRTPLTSIKGNASLILDFYKEILKDPELKEMVEDIHTSSVRLIEIVNDFLDVSRLEQGKISFAYTSVSVEKIVENVAYEMKAVLDEKKLYLKIDKQVLNYLPEVWADENRLKQIIYNLVGNASKFTETGGISIDALVNDKFVKVLVSDTGRGMTPESQLLLFHKFQQASSSLLTRDTTRGTGLGLYISKMIVENMGGKIILESSEIDKGSTFSFTLPIASAEQKTSKPKQPTSSTDSKTGLTAIKPEP
jgi:PAS domain S-box-containing protein